MGRSGVHLAALLLPAALAASCEDPPPSPLVLGRPGLGPGEFDRPRGLAAAAGRVAVVDCSGRLQRFRADGTLENSFEVMPPPALRGFPLGLLLDPDGGALVVHTHEASLVRYSPSGEELSRFGRFGVKEGEFCMPQRAARHGDLLLVSDFGYEECRRVEAWGADGEFLRTLAGPGTGVVFQRPMGVAVDRDGVLWVADTSHRLFRFELPSGRLLGTVGSEGEGAGELRWPTGVAALPEGGVVVAEAGNHRLQRFDARGRPRGTWGRPGSAPGQLRGPYDVAVDPPWLWVADTENHRVQRLVLDAVPWESPPPAASREDR